MKMVIYTCPYIPAEWITAHGLQPSRIILNAADSARSIAYKEGLCPYVRAFIDNAVKSKQACAVIVTTVCDQMRRAFDVIAHRYSSTAFLMNVPNTWQSVAAQKLYLNELKRLGRFLVRLGGKLPSDDDLAKVMLEYDADRASIRAVREYLSSRRYSEVIAEFGWQRKYNITRDLGSSKLLSAGIPLGLVGGPLLKEDFQIFNIVENFGGRIVLDATETGERGMCAPFDHRRIYDNPLMELANTYLGSIHDASRRPNSELYSWLKCELGARAVRGIIFHHYIWCDLWHAEAGRLKDWTDLPVLHIDAAGDNKTYPRRTASRIEAFLEMLQ